MKNNTLWIIAILMILVIVGLGAIFLFSNNLQPAPSSNSRTNVNTNPPSGEVTTPNTPKTYQVSIKSFAFSLVTIKIKKGDTIVWTNMDSAPHTVTSDSGNELDSSSLSNGNTYSHTFNDVGTFSYYCTVHPMMKASVIVE